MELACFSGPIALPRGSSELKERAFELLDFPAKVVDLALEVLESLGVRPTAVAARFCAFGCRNGRGLQRTAEQVGVARLPLACLAIELGDEGAVLPVREMLEGGFDLLNIPELAKARRMNAQLAGGLGTP